MSFHERLAKFVLNDAKKLCREHGAPIEALSPQAIGFAIALEEEGAISRRETRQWIKEGLERDGYSYIAKKKA